MIILLSPQVNDDRIEYTFKKETVKIKINETEETFDFGGLPDGELEIWSEEEGELLIETSLDPFPIISAEKKAGVLRLELLNWIPEKAEETDRFPEWIDATEYEPPKEPEEDEDGGEI